MNSTSVVLALGGNLGDVANTFRQAAAALTQAGLTELKCSSFYRTVPVDCPPGTPDFLNAVVIGNWNGPVEMLHAITKNLEKKFGRPSLHGRHTSRTLDIDIILFGEAIVETPELTIPHREAARRRFVLEPWAEIAPDRIFPGTGRTVRELLAELP